MRRRKDESPWPRWLVEYRPEDWPAPRCHPECAYWDAHMAWIRANPDKDTPPGVGPDTPWHPEEIGPSHDRRGRP